MHKLKNSTWRGKLLLAIVFLITLGGMNFTFSQGVNEYHPIDTSIVEPLTIDSILIFPQKPHEGDEISILVSSTHSASPCGLLNYEVIHNDTNTIFVNAQYWQGMADAICYSVDSIYIGSLKPGNYILNFMNMDKIEFTVYPVTDCRADFDYQFPEIDSVAPHANLVQFIDKSKGGPMVGWKWNFGDGETSWEQNPLHDYDSAGIYDVCLTVYSSDNIHRCMDTVCKQVLVPGGQCKAKFSYEVIDDMILSNESGEPSSASAPNPSYLVKFFDESLGNVIHREWSFGDGRTDTILNLKWW